VNADYMSDEGMSAFDRAYLLALDDNNQGVVRNTDEYLRLVPADEQVELAMLIATLTLRIPASPSAAEFAEGYARAMIAIEAVETSAGLTGILPGALERMERARAIEPEHVVAALANEFNIASAEGHAALRRHYHRIRSGQLLGSRIAHRLLAALARIFGAEPEDFIAAVRPFGAAPQLNATAAMPRPAGEASRAATPVATPDVPHPDENLVKTLFCGGPNA
jgi:hypothetical protein